VLSVTFSALDWHDPGPDGDDAAAEGAVLADPVTAEVGLAEAARLEAAAAAGLPPDEQPASNPAPASTAAASTAPAAPLPARPGLAARKSDPDSEPERGPGESERMQHPIRNAKRSRTQCARR
jgi:hypothetical protein